MGAAGGGLQEARAGSGRALSPGEQEQQEEVELGSRSQAPSALSGAWEPQANNPGCGRKAEPRPSGRSGLTAGGAGWLAVSALGCAPARALAAGPALALLAM